MVVGEVMVLLDDEEPVVVGTGNSELLDVEPPVSARACAAVTLNIFEAVTFRNAHKGTVVASGIVSGNLEAM